MTSFFAVTPRSVRANGRTVTPNADNAASIPPNKVIDLGLRKNLYMQQVECANQQFYGVEMPCKAFACDVEGIQALRQLALDSTNKVLPLLLSVLVADDDDDTPLVVTNANFHCTCSWKTRADKGRLLSKPVATKYASGDAPWDDTLPAAMPNGTNGKKTAESVFSKKYTEAQLAEGKIFVGLRLDECRTAFRVEYLNKNNDVFSGRNDLDSFLKRKSVSFPGVAAGRPMTRCNLAAKLREHAYARF